MQERHLRDLELVESAPEPVISRRAVSESSPDCLLKTPAGIHESDYANFLVVSDSQESVLESIAVKQHSGIRVSRLLGNFYSVTLPKDQARNFLTKNEVLDFSLNLAIPLLNKSNPAVKAPAFYSHADYNGISTSICIVDTGIRDTHDFFSGKTFEILSCEGKTGDDSGHGTHVAGITASLDSNYTGIAKGSVHLIDAKSGQGSTLPCAYDNLPECFSDDRNKKAVVANNSWGSHNTNCGGSREADGLSLESIYIDALAYHYSKTLVFAAGNDGACSDHNSLSIPADAYNVISVGSVDTNKIVDGSDDSVSSFSSRGPTYDGRKKPDLVAPGANNYEAAQGIVSASHSDNSLTANMAGTSMAAPHVAGAAALVIGKFGLDWLEAKALLINSADHMNSSGWNKDYGWGYLNLEKAALQGNYTFSDSIEKASSNEYFAFLEKGDKATIAWARHCDLSGFDDSYCSQLTNLDLFLYDANEDPVHSSISEIDNVEQVVAPETGYYRIEVVSQNEDFDSGLQNEKYALALSKGLLLHNVLLSLTVLPESMYSSKQDQNIQIRVLIANYSENEKDLNVAIFIDSEFFDYASISIPPYSDKTVSFTKTIDANFFGDLNILASADLLNGKKSLADKNYSIMYSIPRIDSAIDSVQPEFESDTRTIGQEVSFDVNAVNKGSLAQDINVLFYANGILLDFKSKNIEAGNSKIYSFSNIFSDPEILDFNLLFVAEFDETEFDSSDNNYSLSYSLKDTVLSVKEITLESEKEFVSNNPDYNTAIIKVRLLNQGDLSAEIDGNALVLENKSADITEHFIISGGATEGQIIEAEKDANIEFKITMNNLSPDYDGNIDITVFFEYTVESSIEAIFLKENSVFKADNTPPETEVLMDSFFYGPNTWNDENTIKGTAFDALSGIKKVELNIVAIKSVDNNTLFFYWDGNAWNDFDFENLPEEESEEELWAVLPVETIDGYATWNYPFNKTNFELTENYSGHYVVPIATDNAGNVFGNYSHLFFYDSIPPIKATVDEPGEGAHYIDEFPLPKGTAADNNIGSGLDANSTTFYIKALSGTNEGKYWDAFSQTWSDAKKWLLTDHNETWEFSSESIEWTAEPEMIPDAENGEYEIRARATDRAGNTFDGNTITFTVSIKEKKTTSSSAGGGGGGGGIGTPRTTPTPEPTPTPTPDPVDKSPVLRTEYVSPNLPEKLSDYFSSDEISTMANNTKKSSFERTIQLDYSDENKPIAKIVIKVNFSDDNIKNFNLIEVIPKSIAENASLISSDYNFRVIDSNPVIEFISVSGNELSYYVNKEIDLNSAKDYSNPVISKAKLSETVTQTPSLEPTPSPTPSHTPTEEKEKTDEGILAESDDQTLFFVVFILIVLFIILSTVYYFKKRKEIDREEESEAPARPFKKKVEVDQEKIKELRKMISSREIIRPNKEKNDGLSSQEITRSFQEKTDEEFS